MISKIKRRADDTIGVVGRARAAGRGEVKIITTTGEEEEVRVLIVTTVTIIITLNRAPNCAPVWTRRLINLLIKAKMKTNIRSENERIQVIKDIIVLDHIRRMCLTASKGTAM